MDNNKVSFTKDTIIDKYYVLYPSYPAMQCRKAYPAMRNIRKPVVVMEMPPLSTQSCIPGLDWSNQYSLLLSSTTEMYEKLKSVSLKTSVAAQVKNLQVISVLVLGGWHW